MSIDPVLIWFLASFPQPPAGATEPAIDFSLAAIIGKAIEPLLHPVGFNWQIAVALIPGMAAREVAVAALGTVYAIEGGKEAAEQIELYFSQFPDVMSLSNISRTNPLSAQLAYIVFVDDPGGFPGFYDDGEQFSVAAGFWGFNPNDPTHPEPFVHAYSPLSTDPPPVGDPNQRYAVSYRWTRGGLAGIDFTP